MSAVADQVDDTEFPSAKRQKRQSKPNRNDQQFLPADLEILETPPSPVRMALILLIAAFVVVALTWSWLGRIDIVAIAQGKIQPTGRIKVIQPLEPGKVAAIRVRNGMHVKAGDILIEMDQGDAEAEDADEAAAFAAWRAEAARRHAAIKAATFLASCTSCEGNTAQRPAIQASLRQDISSIPEIVWAADIPPQNRSREERVFASDLGQLKAAMDSIDAQIKQKEIERDHLSATVAAENNLIATLQQRVDMRATLVDRGAGTKASLIDSEETLQYQQTQIQIQMGQRAQAAANINVLNQEREKTLAAFIAENAQKLAEAQRQADDFQQRLIKAQLKLSRTALTSPTDGIVMGLTVTTIGQVIQSGDEIMRIVPADATLEIECYLPNKDIGFVKAGQKAVVKVESFPFTRYGTISAIVSRVADDAIPEPDAAATEADPAKAGKGNKLFAGAERTQNLMFPVTLKLDKPVMEVDGRSAPLTPGMAVSVEIATGSRRILSYVFSPLVETASEAMKER